MDIAQALGPQGGLLRLLEERAAAAAAGSVVATPLPVVGPASVGRFLSRVASHRARASFAFVPFAPFNDPFNPVRAALMESARRSRSGLGDLVSVPVRHCKDAHGVVMAMWGGEKIVYSGDTRPCDRLARAGVGATLLIHEATFDDDRAEDAARKRHCTVREALGVAAKMRAEQTVLTHFSQRYPRVISGDSGGRGDINITWCVAFDGMRVRLGAGESAGEAVGSVAGAARSLSLIRSCLEKKKEEAGAEAEAEARRRSNNSHRPFARLQ